jgi:hypothetical protein
MLTSSYITLHCSWVALLYCRCMQWQHLRVHNLMCCAPPASSQCVYACLLCMCSGEQAQIAYCNVLLILLCVAAVAAGCCNYSLRQDNCHNRGTHSDCAVNSLKACQKLTVHYAPLLIMYDVQYDAIGKSCLVTNVSRHHCSL